MENSRDYLSYSQLLSWERGTYYNDYIIGTKRESCEMDFGKKIADGLENNSSEKDVEFFRMWIPEAKEREKEINITIEGINIKVKIDGFNPGEIYEYKTGKTKWTQGKADKTDQLTIYSMIYWYKFKEYARLFLIWIPTQNNGEEIELTGELPKTFETKRTIADYGAILKRFKEAKKGIDKLYASI